MWFKNRRIKLMTEMLEHINRMQHIINDASQEGKIASVVAIELDLRLMDCMVTLAELGSKSVEMKMRDSAKKDLNKFIKKLEKEN